MIHPWKLTAGTQKSPNWKGTSSSIHLHDFELHVNCPGCKKSFQSTHVFPHPTETTPGEISVTWTHALSKVFLVKTHSTCWQGFFFEAEILEKICISPSHQMFKTYFGAFFWNRSPIPKLPPFGDFCWWQQYSCEKVCSKKKSNLLQLWRQPCALNLRFKAGGTGRPYPTHNKKFRPRRHKPLLNVKEYIV